MEVWNTPFKDTEYPSVGMFINMHENEVDEVFAIVAPDGIDRYPKYLISYGRNSVEVKYYEEAFSPERGYELLVRNGPKVCSLIWNTSPSVRSYEDYVTDKNKLKHFIIFGGDNILEVVTADVPKIEVISSPASIRLSVNV